MTTLGDLIRAGYRAYGGLTSYHPNYPNTQKFEGFAVKGFGTNQLSGIAANSNYLRPIDKNPTRLSGYSRGWGQASTETQYSVMDLILENSKHLSPENQALLLATARVESGFNPDAAATTTSASGVFQLISKTANNLGLSQANIFNANENIKAGIDLFEENMFIVSRRYPQLSGNERAVMLYAFHHDGPSLAYGGAAIARKNILPYLDNFRAITYQNAFNEIY